MADEQTARGMVRRIQSIVLKADELTPTKAAELETKLTALLGVVNAESREADANYNLVLLKHLESEEAASRAKIRAETTPEYARKREARDVKELTVELIRSLRHYLRTANEEMRLSR
jgi:hypothetical protein